MPESPQTYKSHRRLIPIYHYFVTPVLVLNVFVELLRLNKYRTPYHVWLVVFAIALVILPFTVRSMVTRVQDRVIRLEERARLGALLPPDMRGRVNELTTSQLVGLRFASDEEVTDLARRCLAGELTRGDQVKREVKTWRPDYLRA